MGCVLYRIRKCGDKERPLRIKCRIAQSAELTVYFGQDLKATHGHRVNAWQNGFVFEDSDVSLVVNKRKPLRSHQLFEVRRAAPGNEILYVQHVEPAVLDSQQARRAEKNAVTTILRVVERKK